jgi:hypothetical protein
MARGADYFSSVIRIFPDYADSVIWFAMGSVSYEEAKISAQLRHDMEAWERFYYQACSNEFRWRTQDDQARFAAQGRRLAERLAAEVGGQFEVEFENHRGKKVRTRSNAGSTNAAAAEAFTEIARQEREFDERVHMEAQTGATFGWFTHDPREKPDQETLS